MLVLAIVALGVPLAINLRARVGAEVKTQAQAQADLVAATAADLLGLGNRRELRTLARTAAASVRGRVLVVDRAGTVLVDSAGPAEVGASYRSRPELAAALAGRPQQVQRGSKTLGKAILATAVPVLRDGRPQGAVRVTESVTAVNSAVRRAVLGLALLGFVVLALGLLAGAIIAAQVGRPIKRLEAVARRVSSGDLTAKAEVEGSREQRALARSFNDMTERVSGLIGAQRDFVADASHQLRTPLTGLRLRLEEARAVAPDPASVEIGAAMAELDRLSHTVDELLMLSGAGERRSAAMDLDLGEVAASGVTRWQAYAAEHEVSLQSHRQPHIGTVRASRLDVERALDGLLENAIHYSARGTAVTVEAASGAIAVRDRGRGVADDELEMVFERFHRGRAGRAGPAGSGLGLTIARELVRVWGGEVTIKPRPGGGAVATLSLPVSAPDEVTGAEPPLPAINPPTSSLHVP